MPQGASRWRRAASKTLCSRASFLFSWSAGSFDSNREGRGVDDGGDFLGLCLGIVAGFVLELCRCLQQHGVIAGCELELGKVELELPAGGLGVDRGNGWRRRISDAEGI